MGQQPQLQTLLKSILGSNNVYFQPPPNTQMAYPAIRYNLDFSDTKFADNKSYHFTWRYQVTYIDRSPSSAVKDKLAALPMCTFQRFFAADGLNHYIYDLYF